MPGARRPGRPSREPSELPALAVPVTIAAFEPIFLADLARLPASQPNVLPSGLKPLPDFAVRERRALVLRLARSILEAENRAEEFKLADESRARLMAARDAFASVAASYSGYWSARPGSENRAKLTEIMLSAEESQRLPIPPYLVCEAAALSVVFQGGGDERLDVSTARWFELGDREDAPSDNRRLWRGLVRHATALLEIARRHDPDLEPDEEEIVWAMDVLAEIRKESDHVRRAIGRIAASMEGTMQPDPRLGGRRRNARLSEASPNVEAYLWRQCGVATNEIKCLLRTKEGEQVADTRVASVVEAAKVALTRPGERLARKKT